MTNQSTTEHGFWRRYIFPIDHKTIGKQYLWLGLIMTLVGGMLAYYMRRQLAWHESNIISPNVYNAFVIMHGTIVVFFAAMPILLRAFGNFLIPVMIGADDMAFHRLNMFSFSSPHP